MEIFGPCQQTGLQRKGRTNSDYKIDVSRVGGGREPAKLTRHICLITRLSQIERKKRLKKKEKTVAEKHLRGTKEVGKKRNNSRRDKAVTPTPSR